MIFSNLFRRNESRAAALQPADDTLCIDIFCGGSGNIIGGMQSVMAAARAFAQAADGRPDLHNDLMVSIDMDAQNAGAAVMNRVSDAICTLAAADTTGALMGPLEFINAIVSQNMGSDAQASIDDMVAEDSEAQALVQAVLTPAESQRPREAGGYGLPKIVNIWNNKLMEVDTMQMLMERILRAYQSGRRIVIRMIGSATGATGAALQNALAKDIYTACRSEDAKLIEHLRIHNVVLMGYAAHPPKGMDDPNEDIRLDSCEDAVRVLNWWKNRENTGVDTYSDRVYLVDTKKTLCCDQYAIGGDQGRRYCFGDLLALLALKDSAETAFDPARDGCQIFGWKEEAGDDHRVRWDSIGDVAFKCTFVNFVRLAAFVWLKLKPMTVGVGDDEILSAPHIRKMLGRRAGAADVEKVIQPMEAMLKLAREALKMALEIGGTGSDWIAEPPILSRDENTLFDPHLLDALLSARIRNDKINEFELDALTDYEVGGGRSRSAFSTGETVGAVYQAATSRLERDDTVPEYLLEIYRALQI